MLRFPWSKPAPTKPTVKPTKLDTPWWDKDERDISDALINQVINIQGQQGGIRQRNYRAARLYGGHGFITVGRFAGAMGSSWGSNAGGYFGSYTSPRYNLIYAMVNTLFSRLIAPGLPGIGIVTNDADWDLQQRAELMEDWLEGTWYRNGCDAEKLMAGRDSLVFGNGFVDADTDADGRITNHRLFPETVWTEMFDGKDGRPHCVYYVDLIDRDELCAKFPGKEAEIMRAQVFSTKGYDSERAGARVVPIYKGWHMNSSEKRNDGVAVTAIDGAVIQVKEWKRRKPPIAKLTYDDGLTGYLGRGMAELLYPHQAALSAIQRAEYYAWSQTALPRLWLDMNSKINDIHMMSSRSGGIIRGKGTPPQVLNWSGTHPDFVAYKQWVISSAYEFMGISQLSASGEKPAGLNAAVAQREYMDIQTERFAQLSHKWEQFAIDIADITLAEAAESYGEDRDNKFTVAAMGGGFVKKISWGQVNMDRDAFALKAYPVSSLPHSPAGRLQMVSELMQAQLITREVGLKLLKFPDLDSELAMANAMRDYAERNAWLILRRGKLPAYDSLPDLQQCVTTLQQMSVKAMNGGLSPNSTQIKNARAWLVGAKRMATPPAPQLPPGAPLAKGAPPPVSQQLPFAQAA